MEDAQGKPIVTVDTEAVERAVYGTSIAKKKYTDKKIQSILTRVQWHMADSVEEVKKRVLEMPASAKAQLARNPEFVEYLEAYAIDVLMGGKKPSPMEWAAHQFLAKHLNLQGRVKGKKGIDAKNASALMDADVVVEAEGAGEA